MARSSRTPRREFLKTAAAGFGAFGDGLFDYTFTANWADIDGDGDGTTYLPLVALDVAGHEMTHGVTSRSANLTYSGESGGLNEATSDIMGTMVEYYANNANSPANYLIGERIYKAALGVAQPTKALRYMFKPSLDGSSPDCYTSTIGNLDVHYSSGVANQAHVYRCQLMHQLPGSRPGAPRRGDADRGRLATRTRRPVLRHAHLAVCRVRRAGPAAHLSGADRTRRCGPRPARRRAGARGTHDRRPHRSA